MENDYANEHQRVDGEVVDERTGEIIPKGSPPELKPGILAQININQVGTLEVGEESLKVLEEPLDPNDVQIRPDGLVYLPWTWYNKKLNRAFGILKWGLIPQGAPQIKEMGNSTLVVWLNWLVVKGIPVSMAGGETSYQPSNYTMSYGDAMEGARTNSLSRNCKNLGMAIELWDWRWVEEWKRDFAETYPNPNPNARQKQLWRKKKVSQASSGYATTKQELVMTAVGYVSKEAWDEHANRIVESNTPIGITDETPKPDEPKKFKVSELRTLDMVKGIAALTKKNKSDIAALIGGLDTKISYSISEIAKLLNGEKENAKS